MLGASLVVVHDALVGGQDDDAELTGGEHGVAEVLELAELQIEAGRDDAALVEAAVQVDDDLAIAGVVDDLKLVNVAVSLHDTEELDEDLGDRSQDNLSFASLLGVAHVLQCVVHHGHLNHFGGGSKANDLKLVNVAVSLHDTEELDEDLGDRSQDNLKYHYGD
eukprot:CAMPEP_0185622594 /NCGR_PEP_ID=MMETSP0436-20130131/59315_1 /TAXON_ID=626734 ORGANISM="Favella taraikaensis, Strain Fe Narragansett Bay" /NCGR_SAMPLE_ID=MMETSP0436 /ASSEMBLY_ACC=CAM_ASM_000390 /LENGTH=163 /DNA_ID=CAMNT_0028264377 /DNA_START=143 /DNA_END=634 /DNA_ORIENTATION=-